MATFKQIRGQTIKKYTTNPTNPLEGQMLYNNTTGTLKGRIVSEAWSAGLKIGGLTPGSTTATEEFTVAATARSVDTS